MTTPIYTYLEKRTLNFLKKSKEVHGDKFDYSLVEYKGYNEYVNLICKEHGVFPQTPHSHLNGAGCPQCSSKGYSKIAIKWLNSISLDIQHAENGGEYRIPNTKYRVDGYVPSTNTVYEFHGDVFHGNPELFKPTDNCHPFNKYITAKELYDKTIERENEIKSLGYNLIVMWESDFITFN